MKKALSVIGKILSTALTVILLLAVLILGYATVKGKITGKSAVTIFGISAGMVQTGSMEGSNPDSINANDCVLTVKREEYKVGDVISFYPAHKEAYDHTITHRIIEITEDGKYIVKGDANNVEDQVPVPPEKVVGKVFYIIRDGVDAFNFLSSPTFLAVLFVVAMIPTAIRFVIGRSDADDEDGVDEEQEGEVSADGTAPENEPQTGEEQ